MRFLSEYGFEEKDAFDEEPEGEEALGCFCAIVRYEEGEVDVIPADDEGRRKEMNVIRMALQ